MVFLINVVFADTRKWNDVEHKLEIKKSSLTFERSGMQTPPQQLFLRWTSQWGKIKNAREYYGVNTLNKQTLLLPDQTLVTATAGVLDALTAGVFKQPGIPSQCSVTLIISMLVTHPHSFTILLSQGNFQTYNLTKPEHVRVAPADFTCEFEFCFLQS